MAPTTKLPAVLVAAALLTTGCGTDGDGPERVAAVERAPDRVIETRRGTVANEPMTAQLLAPRRRGATVSVTARITNDSTSDAHVSGWFDDGVEQAGASHTADAMHLIDPVNGRKLLPERDPSSACWCSDGLASTLPPHAGMALSATFPSPPEDVRSVDVVVPSFGTFADVPLR